jgi:hypothetical protein
VLHRECLLCLDPYRQNSEASHSDLTDFWLVYWLLCLLRRFGAQLLIKLVSYGIKNVEKEGRVRSITRIVYECGKKL